MSNLSYVLNAVKQVKQNPNSAIRSDLDYGLGDLSSKQDRLASKTELTQKENQLRSDLTSTAQELTQQQAALASKSEVKQISQSVQSDLADTQDATKEANQQAKSATIKAERADRNSRDAVQQIRDAEMQLESLINSMNTKATRMSEAMMGNMEFRLDDGVDSEISAAALNAAEAGEFTRLLAVALCSKLPKGEDFDYPVNSWATGIAPTVTPGNTGCWDPTVAPVEDPDGDVALNYGLARATVTFITDEGDTKIYVEGDTVTVKVKITVSDTKPWLVAEVTKTYTVVA
jgi:hypothetical protein